MTDETSYTVDGCPFCEYTFAEIEENDTSFYVECGSCGAKGPRALTKRGAAYLWNRRNSEN